MLFRKRLTSKGKEKTIFLFILDPERKTLHGHLFKSPYSKESIRSSIVQRSGRLSSSANTRSVTSRFPNGQRDLARFRNFSSLPARDGQSIHQPRSIACRCAQRGRVNAQQGRCPLNSRRFLTVRVNRPISNFFASSYRYSPPPPRLCPCPTRIFHIIFSMYGNIACTIE